MVVAVQWSVCKIVIISVSFLFYLSSYLTTMLPPSYRLFLFPNSWLWLVFGCLCFLKTSCLVVLPCVCLLCLLKRWRVVDTHFESSADMVVVCCLSCPYVSSSFLMFVWCVIGRAPFRNYELLSVKQATVISHRHEP